MDLTEVAKILVKAAEEGGLGREGLAAALVLVSWGLRSVGERAYKKGWRRFRSLRLLRLPEVTWVLTLVGSVSMSCLTTITAGGDVSLHSVLIAGLTTVQGWGTWNGGKFVGKRGKKIVQKVRERRQRKRSATP